MYVYRPVSRVCGPVCLGPRWDQPCRVLDDGTPTDAAGESAIVSVPVADPHTTALSGHVELVIPTVAPVA